MRVTPLHLLRQGATIEALLRTALASRPGSRPGEISSPAAEGDPDGAGTGHDPSTERLTEPKRAMATLPPRAPELVRDYIRAVGGDPIWYRGRMPPHLFPQWGFPLLSSNLRGLPYDLTKVLNAGARIEVRGDLPAHEPLSVTAVLESVDANERRVLIRQRLETGTPSAPDALVAWTTAILPLGKGGGDGKSAGRPAGAPAGREEKKERPHVPEDAREIDRWRLSPDAGLEFAVLTGDINPIHWLKPYARMAGFKSPILHGFGILARAIESLNRGLWSGDASRLASIEARFVRPMPLPAKPGVYVDGRGGVFVGDAPGGPAYMVGEYLEKENG